MIDIEIVKKMLIEKYHIYNKKSKLFINQKMEIEFMQNAISIIFGNFEFIYFSFNYDSENQMFESISSFIEILLREQIRIKEYYYDDKLYKRKLEQNVKGIGWKTIACSKKMSLKRKNIKIYEKTINFNEII